MIKILIIIFIALLVILGIVSAICKKLQAENLALKTDLMKKENSLKVLVENIKQIQRITKDNEKVRKEIENAETEEEILQIVNTIVNANNGRVRK